MIHEDFGIEDEYDGPDEPWPGDDPEARSVEEQDRRAELTADADAGIVIMLTVDGSEPVDVIVHHGDLVTIITSNDGWQSQIAAVEITRAGSMDPEQAWIEAVWAMARRAERGRADADAAALAWFRSIGVQEREHDEG